MTRKNVLVVPMFKYRRSAPKKPFLNWGYEAIRKATTIATSPKLLAYRACIARELVGKKFPDLKTVQETFRETAHKCKGEVAGKPTKPKKGRVLTL